MKVKEDKFFELISLGCFNGDENYLRLTKGDTHTCTVFSDSKTFSWEWGKAGYTAVSNNVNKKGRMIQECIEKDFRINLNGT